MGSPSSPRHRRLRAADPKILTPFYTDYATFGGSSRRIEQLLKIIMDRGAERGYFSEPSKSLFITDFLEQEDAEKREFMMEGLYINFVGGSWYPGGYIGPR